MHTSFASFRLRSGKREENKMTTVAEGKIAPAETSQNEKPGGVVRKALGRGLESLLPGGPRVVGGATAPVTIPGGSGGAAASSQGAVIGDIQAQAARLAGEAVLQIPLELIDRNPYQT